MSELDQEKKRILYVIVCAAPPAQYIDEFIRRVQKIGWDVCVIATPQATRFMDIPRLTELTGHLVRNDYKQPGEADPLPKADAIVVVPATFNTINKWALGIGDTLAVSILCEVMGNGRTPIVAVPCLKMDLVRHPAFPKSIEVLRACGVRILHEPERYPSPLMVPWDEIIDALPQASQE
jgi:phosphopantothenoylcysteine synthetase/decarboxylase